MSEINYEAVTFGVAYLALIGLGVWYVIGLWLHERKLTKRDKP